MSMSDGASVSSPSSMELAAALVPIGRPWSAEAGAGARGCEASGAVGASAGSCVGRGVAGVGARSRMVGGAGTVGAWRHSGASTATPPVKTRGGGGRRCERRPGVTLTLTAGCRCARWRLTVRADGVTADGRALVAAGVVGVVVRRRRDGWGPLLLTTIAPAVEVGALVGVRMRDSTAGAASASAGVASSCRARGGMARAAVRSTGAIVSAGAAIVWACSASAGCDACSSDVATAELAELGGG